ncbi:three-Cys-motif partner protein TcmP, partial [Sphingobium sp. DC-2]|uniref:three-Cys-motif partner protein TcmP n=1 Tax=Sphingobium sp. DC-2 TaxID=1303256 RepID=UPI0004C47169
MALEPEHYAGREQALVKHHFLKHYLESLIHKIASKYGEVVYVDGFSGPWQNQGERFEDTSFGIALQALTDAGRSWAEMPHKPRSVKMTAHLVEKNPTAYRRLAELQPMFPDVEIVTHNGNFTEIAPAIARTIPAQAFAFILIDPKGFSLDLQALKPLISRPRSEVVFNFMFDFVNRFALYDDDKVAPILDRLIPTEDWRSQLRVLEQNPKATPEIRKRLIVEAFERAVSKVGGYDYVANVDVRRPDRDRTLYFLVYGTRQPPGIKVFRDCQVKSLGVQADIIGRKKLEKQATASSQFELLGSMQDMAPDANKEFLREEIEGARRLLMDLAPVSGAGVPWGELWPKVLANHVVRLTDRNRTVEAACQDVSWAG